MSLWDDASAAITAVFVDDETIAYTSDQFGVLQPIAAIVIDAEASQFAEPGGRTLRRRTYEIVASLLPGRPTNKDSLVHAGHHWKVEQAQYRPPIKAWHLDVVDQGAA